MVWRRSTPPHPQQTSSVPPFFLRFYAYLSRHLKGLCEVYLAIESTVLTGNNCGFVLKFRIYIL